MQTRPGHCQVSAQAGTPTPCLTLLPLSCMPVKSSRLMNSCTPSGTPGTRQSCMGVGSIAMLILASGTCNTMTVRFGSQCLCACHVYASRHTLKQCPEHKDIFVGTEHSLCSRYDCLRVMSGSSCLSAS